MNELILLDPGHGGVIDGNIMTPGKGYFSERTKFSEGVYNRMIVHGVAFHLTHMNIPVEILVPESNDVRLGNRINRANKKHAERNCILFSIHQNAFSDPSAHGAEFFTSRGETASDAMAEHMGRRFASSFPNRKLRRDHIDEYSKDRNFLILVHTNCPAVLTEWGFMTNPQDRKYLLSFQGITDQIGFLVSTISEIWRGQYKK